MQDSINTNHRISVKSVYKGHGQKQHMIKKSKMSTSNGHTTECNIQEQQKKIDKLMMQSKNLIDAMTKEKATTRALGNTIKDRA